MLCRGSWPHEGFTKSASPSGQRLRGLPAKRSKTASNFHSEIAHPHDHRSQSQITRSITRSGATKCPGACAYRASSRRCVAVDEPACSACAGSPTWFAHVFLHEFAYFCANRASTLSRGLLLCMFGRKLRLVAILAIAVVT